MPRIVTLQFNPAGKMYDFDAGVLELMIRDQVLVETERGVAIATVVRAPVDTPSGEHTEGLVPVIRIATSEDLETVKRNTEKEKEAYDFCNKRIVDRGLQMKLVRVEYLFDGSKAIFYFTADGRVDFRVLVKDLAHTFHTRIEMRQIGVRDESKMVGGIGICGRELCCCSWLRDFQPVSVKMAKEQNLALNPSKISGQCGRLLCCLDYEYDTYCSLRKDMPKCGKRVCADGASGVVDKLNILTGNVTIKLDDGKLVTVNKEEIKLEANVAEPVKTEQPATVSRAGNKNRERQNIPRPHTEETTISSDTANETSNTAGNPLPKEGQTRSPRKKHRSRKSGQRKAVSGNGTGENGTPSGSPKQ